MKNPHAVALGRKGGKVKSLAKANAARETLAAARAKLPHPFKDDGWKRCEICGAKRGVLGLHYRRV